MVTLPSRLSPASRPEKLDRAIRPQTAAEPPLSVSAASAKDDPISTSGAVRVRDCIPVRSRSSVSWRSQSDKTPRRAWFSFSASVVASDFASGGAVRPMGCPASRTVTPAVREARRRSSTASSTWPETVRPNRASHAFGIASVFSIVPVAVPSARYAPDGLESVSVSVALSD